MKQLRAGNKGLMGFIENFGRSVVDFALPPRCAGCGAIVVETGTFCPPCWTEMDWLTDRVCTHCSLPLEGTEEETCAACLADPPRVAKLHAATKYGAASKTLALRLKHGRRVAYARVMAKAMARRLEEGEWEEAPLLLPVPLHRGRIWRRGFNQASLLASELSRRVEWRWSPDILMRDRATPSLGGLSGNQRRRAVRGAFRVVRPEEIAGKTVMLVDDVYTSGSTVDACAIALEKAGVRRVDAIVWARVQRPRVVMR
ncbi:ComF family protein [Sphingomicrobium lutaoense]|uniref:ComF family protein n=1 Tax=Sphingomicrobium lutaoense TaxID=515949 RepID=A0A839YXV4_9SPHN|nr:ComF family protein [Sphingomicrobium lutaoense]MBB3763310.1 ComF family protein [Sphingomicrobium lutaoense]